MRRTALFLLTLAFIASAPAAHAQSSGSLVIAVLLRPAGHDAITACQDSELRDPSRLQKLLEQAFSLDNVSGSFSSDSQCVTFHSATTITTHGLGDARSIEISFDLHDELVDSYRSASLVVCTPLLSDTIRIFEGDKPTITNSCRFGGYRWDAMQPISFQLTFRATSNDIERGVLGSIAWLLSIACVIALAMRGARPLFQRGSILGTLVILFFCGLAFDGWVQVAYYSHLLHWLQLDAQIGEAGGGALVAIPGALSALAIGYAGVLFTRRTPEPIGPIEEADRSLQRIEILHDSDTIMPFVRIPARPRMLWVMVIPPLAFFISFVMFVTYLGGAEVKIEGMIATLFVYGFAVRYVARGLLPFLHSARPIEFERMAAIVTALRELGAQGRQILVSSLAPAASPLGGAILAVGDRVTIWEPMLSLDDAELAGAIALRPTRVRGWPASLAFLIVTLAIAIPARSDGHIPFLAIVVPVVILVAIGLKDVISSIRVRDRVVRSPQVESYIRGMLTAARATARLAAAGSLGLFGLKAPTYAAGAWSRALRSAEAIAREANLPSSVVTHIADEIRATESGLTGTGAHGQ
ncbi:MAG: hypothetical protein ACYDCC_02360 [Actinomycetota bacterium]